VALILFFMLILTFRYHTLLMFINFQKILRLERLFVERENYQRSEKQLFKVYKGVATLICTFILGYVITAIILRHEVYTVLSG
jgi:hypothetical protein